MYGKKHHKEPGVSCLNVETEVFPKNLESVWAESRTSSGSAKFYVFL